MGQKALVSRADLVALHVGQLIKDPYFTLFEAVGALEVSLDNRLLDRY